MLTEDLFTSANLVAFLSLTTLEIILGVDNLVFLAVICDRLPKHQQALGRQIGLAGAMVMRILLLLVIDFIAGLTKPIFAWEFLGYVIDPSWRDIILILGGLVLIAKATIEIGHMVSETEEKGSPSNVKRAVAALPTVIVQVMLMDLIFSLDSVITAVGMADHILVMVSAIVIAVAVMMAFAGPVSRFVQRRPSVKLLALAFLVLIGFMLVLDGTGVHVSKGYIYFAMGFALVVEALNLWRRSRANKTSQ